MSLSSSARSFGRSSSVFNALLKAPVSTASCTQAEALQTYAPRPGARARSPSATTAPSGVSATRISSSLGRRVRQATHDLTGEILVACGGLTLLGLDHLGRLGHLIGRLLGGFLLGPGLRGLGLGSGGGHALFLLAYLGLGLDVDSQTG